MVAPLVVAGVMAATSLISGMMKDKAAKEEAERQRKFQGQMTGLQTQQQAIAAQTQGTQNAMQQLVEGYRGALL